MNLKLPITVVDELADHEIRAVGELDLASGDIRIVRYEDYDIATQGLPARHKDYEFTVGVLAGRRTDAAGHERNFVRDSSRAGVLGVAGAVMRYCRC